jgi:hypothetical protein
MKLLKTYIRCNLSHKQLKKDYEVMKGQALLGLLNNQSLAQTSVLIFEIIN